MTSLITSFSGAERVFFLTAFAGGLTFVVMTIMMFVGGGVDGDGQGMDADGLSGDADASFKALSLNGLAAFFMMFGLVSLAATREFGQSTATAALFGAVAGVAAVWTLKTLFSFFLGLEEDGNLKIDNAVGCMGTVYLGLPVEGAGQVELTVQGRLRVLDAVSVDAEAIETGSRVEVVAVENGNRLRVKRA